MFLTGSMRISRKMKDAGNWMITAYASNKPNVMPGFPPILIWTHSKKRLLLFCFSMRRQRIPIVFYLSHGLAKGANHARQCYNDKTSWQIHTGVQGALCYPYSECSIAWTPLWSCMKLNFLSQLERTYSWFAGRGIRKKTRVKVPNLLQFLLSMPNASFI